MYISRMRQASSTGKYQAIILIARASGIGRATVVFLARKGNCVIIGDASG
jgi:NAD(P)-dependent dehydrogenase (short-subunit alcohol dehydrogenase family)